MDFATITFAAIIHMVLAIINTTLVVIKTPLAIATPNGLSLHPLLLLEPSVLSQIPLRMPYQSLW